MGSRVSGRPPMTEGRRVLGSPGSPSPASLLYRMAAVCSLRADTESPGPILALTQTYLCVLPHKASSLTAPTPPLSSQVPVRPTSELQQEQVLRPLLTHSTSSSSLSLGWGEGSARKVGLAALA